MPENLTDTLDNFIKKRTQPTIIRGSVISVDMDTLQCDVQPDTDGSAPILGADLCLGLEGVYGLPSVGSSVIVAMENSATGTIIHYSGVEEIHIFGERIKLGSSDSDSTSGWVVVEMLLQKLNNLENQVNLLAASYKTHVHASSGAPITVPFTAPDLQLTMQSDIENPNITQ